MSLILPLRFPLGDFYYPDNRKHRISVEFLKSKEGNVKFNAFYYHKITAYLSRIFW
jgi:hypothetical protein